MSAKTGQVHYGEAIDGRAGRAVERIHNYALSRPYSNTITFRPLKSGYVSVVPKLSVDALTQAFFKDSGHNLENAALKVLINQFTDACDPSLSLEANGLLACVLTELIAAKHAHAKGVSEAVPHHDFEAKVRPALEAAIKDTTLTRAIKCHVLQHLRGAYRSSFRQKLKSLNDDLRLGLTRSHIDRIVNLRNALVHEGRYPSAFDYERGFNDYGYLIWMNFVAMCRLAGYDGTLPEFQDGRPLEV